MKRVIIKATTSFLQIFFHPPTASSSRPSSVSHGISVFNDSCWVSPLQSDPILSLPCESQIPWCQPGKISPNSTQHLIEALRLEAELNNINLTQQLSNVQAVSRDTTCHLCPVLCHHPLSPLATQDLPWYLHLRHKLSLLNFHHCVQHSSRTDLPTSTQQVWVFPLDPLPGCRRADSPCHKECTQPSTPPLWPGVPCCHVTPHLPASELFCFPRTWTGKNEGKFTRNKKTREKSYLNELWFTYITLFKPFLMLKSSRNTQRPVISQHQNNLMNAQRLC